VTTNPYTRTHARTHGTRARARAHARTHTHTRFTALFPGLPRWARTRKVKPIWILLKQETVSGSGVGWAICKSAPCSRQTTTPAPHRSDFTSRMPFLPPNQQRQSTESTEVLTLTLTLTLFLNPAPCRLGGIIHPWFDFWFWHYIYCLLVYIVCFHTYPFSIRFPYLSPPLLIFCFENIPAAFPGWML